LKDIAPTILIVEDDQDIAEMLGAFLRSAGYQVVTENWGEDGVRSARAKRPDLVILDVRLPDIDGFEVLERMREHVSTRYTPVIFLTERREREARLQGLALHADDYITKPFDVEELLLRVQNTLARAQRAAVQHPVSGLVMGTALKERLDRLAGQQDWSALVMRVENSQQFREIYGFIAADDLLRATTLIIRDIIQPSDALLPFLGHLGDWCVLAGVPRERAADVKARIEQKLEQSFQYFYRDQDLSAGTFEGKRLTVSVQLLAARATWGDGQAIVDECSRLCKQDGN